MNWLQHVCTYFSHQLTRQKRNNDVGDIELLTERITLKDRRSPGSMSLNGWSRIHKYIVDINYLTHQHLYQ